MRLLSLLALLALSACATTSVGTDDAVRIAKEELPSYWVPKATTTTRQLNSLPRMKDVPVTVEIEYVIDSDGQVRNPKIASIDPPDADARWALTMIKANEFSPGPDNPDGKPVRVRTPLVLQPEVRDLRPAGNARN